MFLVRTQLGTKLPLRPTSIIPHYCRPLSLSAQRSKMSDTEKKKANLDENGDKKTSDGNEAHQYQAGSSTDREKDQWKHRAPYRIHDKADDFPVKWKGKCHCGAVRYELSRDKPLASKYCHCTTCQRMHGVSVTPASHLACCPFQA